MKVTLIQSNIHWEDAQANRDHLDQLMQRVPGDTDIIVLPEMFTTGFTMHATSQSESMDGLTLLWMKEKARQMDAAVIGSIIIQEGSRYYNRLIWQMPDGQTVHYDKKHLFSLALEDQTYTPGKQRLSVSFRDWVCVPLVCYDLRFPVWSRNTSGYDLLIYVANWPQVRSQAWTTLLKARAIENQCFVLGVNRVGWDEAGHYYSGESAIIDYQGDEIATKKDDEDLLYAELDREKLMEFRSQYAFLRDQDAFKLLP
ncbi:MAG TPA: amidohydrolase [Saprospiraceae bacterium]|nr:amidohydrolase [Saprospiraceae bacterium]HQU55763.1 amidohydrolase [Saprospiraceae bacterium]HRV85990.1 amidohydrolase [Saprospiraceae bacterium]